VPELYRTVDAAGTKLAPDNRAHYASLLLLYHLVHSPRAEYQRTLESLTRPPSPLRVADSPEPTPQPEDLSLSTLSLDPSPPLPRTVSAPETAFIAPAALRFATDAARTLADETFHPLAFAALVAGDDDAEALERALLAWASPGVRERAGALLRRSYVAVSVPWAARVLGVSEAGVDMWALAHGLKVVDGVVRLR
jgi:hypothetical protein